MSKDLALLITHFLIMELKGAEAMLQCNLPHLKQRRQWHAVASSP